ncbi:class I SAM-dependent methyltransferase [Crossiella cryophila]|uniref:Methylation protein EvaC n=1 Tax=Crossiella cryophila TaxID=43355 RepID=A0A7W7CC83_9PSEU|nr:class I SAM-dependent methyltransferase [Crossiella cryophila]MBB4678449.1 methylation protein EvaC [Crossiella cryophila]
MITPGAAAGLPTVHCRICQGPVTGFLDLGHHPLSDAFRHPEENGEEFYYRLAVGQCADCTMVQLLESVPRERMFHESYPYHSSGSAVMRAHFTGLARHLLSTELTGPDPFLVELGCNDGVLLRTVHAAGVRHLGFEPSGGVAAIAASHGVRVRTEFFEEATATAVREADGPADVIYAANTVCHLPYLDSVLRGVHALLAEHGVFVFEDPYLGDILAKTAFDQIYDEHFYYFTARSVQALAHRSGLELVDVQRLPVHGGELRYTLARPGRRPVSPAVADLLAEEQRRGLAEPATLHRFAANVARTKENLLALLHDLRAQGHTVVGYGATAKSATVTNFCGISTDLVAYICDTTPAKQGRLSPGAHLPVRPASAFAEYYPDYALLFAWNHAEEIMAKEQDFHAAGGRWIHYVPEVRLR